MWSIIARSCHLPFYAAGQLDCVDGAATQQINGKRGLRVAHYQALESSTAGGAVPLNSMDNISGR